MRFTRNDYETFLNTEFETQQNNFAQIINVKAVVLKERGDVFVGLYQGLGKNGLPIFKVRNSENMPRKNSFWTAVDLRSEKGDMTKFANWGDLSWRQLRNQYQSDYCDCFCAYISKAEDPKFCLVGIKNMTIDLINHLEINDIIAFGPKDPPLQYLLNLLDIVKDSSSIETQSILDHETTYNQWNPTKIEANFDFISLLLENLQNDHRVVIQGPPGTGKTHRMAQLAAKLLADNKSVLVTALTNQALLELAKKEDVEPFLLEGRVSKTSLTIDESKELPKLQQIKDNLCNATPGNLSLASFYLASGWAKNVEEKPFDYVIMDEASQALLPMMAAAMKLGEKIVFIGDQNQLAPIVETNEDIISNKMWWPIIKGFDTICQGFNYKSFLLCDTYRMTQRGAESTGIFYNNELRSVSDIQSIPSSLSILNSKGGPIFVGLDLKVGDKTPINAFDCIFDYVSKIIAENPKTKIAVLSKFKESVRQLQKHFVIKWSASSELPDNIKIETVDRVQGLTVDYCIFFIPNASVRYSLENELFNVATSRARYNTIIVSDKSILRQNMSEEVRKYILKSQEDKFATFEPTTITAGDIGVKVVDKIDLSQYESKKNDKLYVIDTNVFVNCPDILEHIGKRYKTIVPARVLEELDNLKLKDNVDKHKLNDAAKSIHKAFTKQYSIMEEGDVSLLPLGFNKKTADCMILSVALKHKNENAILLTSDNILLSRASGLGVKAMSLKEFMS